MSKTLYVTDLDGTLLSPDSVVTPRSASLLNEAIHRGALFTAATARTPATVCHLLKDIDLQIPVITITGATLWHADDGSFSEPRFMDEERAWQVLDIYRRHNVPSFIYTLEDSKIEIYHIGKVNELEQNFINERKDSPYKHFHIPESGTSVLPPRLDNVLLFYSMQPTEPLWRVYEDVRKLSNLNPYFYHDIFGPQTAILEVFGGQTSKALAIERVREMVGADRVVAFGDNINDLPMLRAADVAIAVENALPEVKQEADMVIGSNETDAVANFILNDLK